MQSPKSIEADPNDPVPLEKILDRLQHQATSRAESKGGLTISTILTTCGPFGPPLVAALLCLPFLQPVPIPGVSTPLGAVIALSGIAVMFKRKIWLPTWLSKLHISTAVIQNSVRFFWACEQKLKPFLHPGPSAPMRLARWILGLSIVSHGALLALPLPIPFSNTVPAWAAFVACLSLLFSSRRAFWLAALMIVANLAFWAALVFSAAWGLPELMKTLPWS